MRKVTFTGTRKGMTGLQIAAVAKLLADHPEWPEAYHGDCNGADAQFDMLCIVMGVHRSIRPSNLPGTRAFCDDYKDFVDAEALSEPMHPLERDHLLVDDGDVLIAVPQHDMEEQRSGTWATVRYARRVGKPIYIVWTNGNVETENVP